MQQALIKVKAYAVFQRGKEILVNEVHERDGSLIGFRIPGGHVEFQEKACDAVLREIKEELNVPVKNVRFLGILENHFSFHGKPGHEVIFVYGAEFEDAALYQQDIIQAYEPDNGQSFDLFWLDPNQRPAGTGFWPDGLVELLTKNG